MSRQKQGVNIENWKNVDVMGKSVGPSWGENPKYFSPIFLPLVLYALAKGILASSCNNIAPRGVKVRELSLRFWCVM